MVVDHNPVPIERNEPLNSSLILSLDKEERSENISNLPPFHIETISCAADPSPSSSPMDSPPPSSIPKQKCASNQCINKADNLTIKIFSFVTPALGSFPLKFKGNEPSAGVTNENIFVVNLENSCVGEKVV